MRLEFTEHLPALLDSGDLVQCFWTLVRTFPTVNLDLQQQAVGVGGSKEANSYTTNDDHL